MTFSEVIHKEVHSLALTVHYTLKVDSGLSWPSAVAALGEALKSPTVKSTKQGGATGFWQQVRNALPSPSICPRLSGYPSRDILSRSSLSKSRPAQAHLSLPQISCPPAPPQQLTPPGVPPQARSSRLIAAIEVSGGTGSRDSRLFRVLRPNLHLSSKPQYIRFKQLRDRYHLVRLHGKKRKQKTRPLTHEGGEDNMKQTTRGGGG